MDDELFREHVIKALRDVHLYCRKIRNESPANWDVEGIAD